MDSEEEEAKMMLNKKDAAGKTLDSKRSQKSIHSRSSSHHKSHHDVNGSMDDFDNQEQEEQKFVLPNSCKLEILSKNKIEKLDQDYMLMAHPFP